MTVIVRRNVIVFSESDGGSRFDCLAGMAEAAGPAAPSHLPPIHRGLR
jgi:hypothetical protein